MNYVLFVVGKEIALPGELQKSLSSQLRDAKDVVLQLKETMQLDQASLENLDPETKTLIRRFARKAKGSNRLDVVEHLREITPAGTTGKSAKLVCFVSVQLHVRYCPRSIPERPFLLCQRLSASFTSSSRVLS